MKSYLKFMSALDAPPITADLTVTERKYLLSALAKIHRSARGLLGESVDRE
jgi:hypothetical protein